MTTFFSFSGWKLNSQLAKEAGILRLWTTSDLYWRVQLLSSIGDGGNISEFTTHSFFSRLKFMSRVCSLQQGVARNETMNRFCCHQIQAYFQDVQWWFLEACLEVRQHKWPGVLRSILNYWTEGTKALCNFGNRNWYAFKNLLMLCDCKEFFQIGGNWPSCTDTKLSKSIKLGCKLLCQCCQSWSLLLPIFMVKSVKLCLGLERIKPRTLDGASHCIDSSLVTTLAKGRWSGCLDLSASGCRDLTTFGSSWCICLMPLLQGSFSTWDFTQHLH